MEDMAILWDTYKLSWRVDQHAAKQGKSEGRVQMKFKKLAAVAACGVLAASMAMFGCSSGSSSSSSSASSAADEATTDTAAYALLNEGQLTLITSPDYPPFENMENGEAVGFEIDLFKAVAEDMGLEFNLASMQFDAIIPAIAAGGQGDVAAAGFSVDPDRAKEIDFTESYYIDDQAVAIMNDSWLADVAHLEDALNQEGVTIAVQTGTTGESYVQENFPRATVQGYGNSTDCFAAMQSGQADAVCTNLAVVKRMLETSYTDAQIVLEVATGEEYAAVVSQDNPELTAAINESLKKLQEDGTIDALTDKWF